MKSSDRRSGRVGRCLLLTLAAVAAVLALAPMALAASTFTGGPIAADTPTTVANDHTVYAVRFAATAGLDANTTYYVKLRFSTGTAPSGTDNRGFTWNPTTKTWIQERADWTEFPTVTTDATGAITQSAWFFVKFGDTSKTGTYYLLASLSIGGAGNTYNCDTPIAVNVIDMATRGYWIHAGTATGQAAKRVSAVDHTTPGNPVALQRTELNGVDDDANGTVDDEVYGPTQSGDFRLALPLAQTVDVLLQTNTWQSGVTSSTADVDIALGAADTTPPSAPASVTRTTTDSSTVLAWDAATDDTAVTGYRVYRVAVLTGVGYTGVPELLDTVTSGTTYTDTTAVAGTDYEYYVRAIDAATNVGPRATAVLPVLKLGRPVAPSVVKRNRYFTVYGSMTPKQTAGTKEVTLKCYRKIGGKWVLKKSVRATAVDYAAASRYKVRFRLGTAGSWKLVASAPETGAHTAAKSSAEFLKVK